MKRLLLLCVSLGVLGACHSASVPSVRQPDGSWHLECGSSLDLCVQKANDLCKGGGYVVLGGMNKRTLLGAELGQSQVEVRQAELNIACADRRGDLPKVLSSNALSLPARAPEPEADAGDAKKPALTACIPGATQRCVGAGACAGGQACAADGSGFGPCDCGSAVHTTPGTP
ncbi:MAG TPA: hypothetical protein VNW92_03340 [Polyangiaceae bacterium]|nr:hypothetical protein [Polyangiaceae bacterium]